MTQMLHFNNNPPLPSMTLLYLDCGIPPNITGAMDQCKNSEELYYKLNRDSLHTMAKEPPVKAVNHFYTVLAGEVGREA